MYAGNTDPNEVCQSSSTCSIHGFVTCRMSMATSRAPTYALFQGLGTTASSSLCGGKVSFFSSSFSRGSFRTKSTIACGQKAKNISKYFQEINCTCNVGFNYLKSENMSKLENLQNIFIKFKNIQQYFQSKW